MRRESVGRELRNVGIWHTAKEQRYAKLATFAFISKWHTAK
jgi:hypothetical protein